jgi:hypothetical protein
MTARALSKIGVPYYVVIEAQERNDYATVLDSKCLLILDPKYQRDYDTFDDLGATKSKGPGPARNFAWDHSIANGHPWHWVMDDNLGAFYRLNRNIKVRLGDGTAFRVMEDFCLRYRNVAMAGPNYLAFAPQRTAQAPIVFNTRIYSCNLIRNDTPFRWRGRYNEDTDLSLRMLKAKWCTVQFNAFLQRKAMTQHIKGGNTEAFYAKEGTLPKSQMLVDMHPDVAKLKFRFGRIHHLVDYRPFRGTVLMPRDDISRDSDVNEYGMRLVDVAATA